MFHSVKWVLLEENQLVLYSVKLVLLKEENPAGVLQCEGGSA